MVMKAIVVSFNDNCKQWWFQKQENLKEKLNKNIFQKRFYF